MGQPDEADDERLRGYDVGLAVAERRATSADAGNRRGVSEAAGARACIPVRWRSRGGVPGLEGSACVAPREAHPRRARARSDEGILHEADRTSAQPASGPVRPRRHCGGQSDRAPRPEADSAARGAARRSRQECLGEHDDRRPAARHSSPCPGRVRALPVRVAAEAGASSRRQVVLARGSRRCSEAKAAKPSRDRRRLREECPRAPARRVRVRPSRGGNRREAGVVPHRVTVLRGRQVSSMCVPRERGLRPRSMALTSWRRQGARIAAVGLVALACTVGTAAAERVLGTPGGDTIRGTRGADRAVWTRRGRQGLRPRG